MRQLNITETHMTLTSVNLRAEKHGEDQVPATDVNLDANMPVEFLDEISVDKIDWKGMLYTKDGEIKGHCIHTINFHREYQEQELHIYINEKKPLKFVDVNIKKIKAEPAQGHRIILKMQAQVHPTKAQNGELSFALQDEVRVDILPSPQKDIEDE